MAALLPFPAPAAAQVYLHSASEEKRADELVESLTKARDAHLAALDAHKAYLTEQLAKQRTLIVQREIAQRDQFFTLLLSASARGQKPREILAQSISADWSELTGEVADPAQLRAFADAALDVRTIELALASLRRDRTLFIQLFGSKGGKGTYCDDKGAGTPAFSVNGVLPEAGAIAATCMELADKSADLTNAYKRAGGASALLGDPNAPGGGMIAAALVEQRDIDGLIKAQTEISKAVKQQMDALQKYYQCELKRTGTLAGVAGIADDVQKALDAFASGDRDKVYDDEKTLDPLLRNLTKDIPNCNASDAEKNPEAAPDKGTPGGITAKQLLDLIGNLDRYAAGNALLAAIQEQALDIKASKLSDALTGLATSSEVEQGTPTATVAAATIRLFADAEQIALAQSGRLPDTVGVLVALAEVRMRQATAKIEADRLAELKRLAGLKVIALRQRATMLSEAGVALQPTTDAAVQMSLLRYASSWNQGAIPAAVVDNDMTYNRYLPWAARERAVVEASYAMLEPAVAEIQVNRKGGITEEAVGDFLHAFGLGAIAVTQ